MKNRCNTTNQMPEDIRNSRFVYDRDANAFRKKAPELLTYKYIVRPAIGECLDVYFPGDRGELRVLDVGSASGRNVHTLIERGFMEKNVLGVEISPEQVAIAQRELPEATFEVGDISNHELPSNAHDLAIMVMVGEFLDGRQFSKTLANIYSSLKSGGAFVYITTHPDRYKAKYGVSEGEVVTKGPWGDEPFVNYVRSVKEQVQTMKKAGFKVDQVRELYIPDEVEEEDRSRREEFSFPEYCARLVVSAHK